jgi:hypothetical protein
MNKLSCIVAVSIIFISIPFQSPAQNYWAGFNNIEYDGKYFYGVADNLYQVVKFNKKGVVVEEFGNRGKGPKEFSTDRLQILLSDSLLYVLDDKAMTITKINKNTFNNLGRITIKKPASGIITYDHILYGYVTDFEESNPLETGEQVNVFRPFDQLNNPEASLFRVKDSNPINPFYDAEIIEATNNSVVIAREGRNRLTIFNNDSLYQRTIPFIEKRSLGEKMEGNTEYLERPMMKVVWKKKIMPEYVLIKALHINDQHIYIQTQSYKLGESLIQYDIKQDKFEHLGSLKKGKLAAVNNDTVYTLYDANIGHTTVNTIQECSSNEIEFYFNSDVFKESCTTCTDSFYKWYDYLNEQNIPVVINFEDDSWFGKREIDSQTLNSLSQWDIWGKIGFKDECNGCFDSSISAKTPSSNKYYSFPEPISTLKESLQCID